MAVNNALDNCQPYTGAFVILGAVQALKDREEFADILHVEAYAVIPHVICQPAILFFRTDFNMGHLPLAGAYRKNIAFSEFDAGHMMYINRPDLQKMQAEIGKFLRP